MRWMASMEQRESSQPLDWFGKNVNESGNPESRWITAVSVVWNRRWALPWPPHSDPWVPGVCALGVEGSSNPRSNLRRTGCTGVPGTENKVPGTIHRTNDVVGAPSPDKADRPPPRARRAPVSVSSHKRADGNRELDVLANDAALGCPSCTPLSTLIPYFVRWYLAYRLEQRPGRQATYILLTVGTNAGETEMLGGHCMLWATGAKVVCHGEADVVVGQMSSVRSESGKQLLDNWLLLYSYFSNFCEVCHLSVGG